MAFSVIIPSRNAANLVPCVNAIREAGETCRIIVVDDGVEWNCNNPVMSDLMIASGHDGWSGMIIPGVKPFIFSRACNQGIRSAGTDDCLILNDDTLLKTPGGFSAMHRAAQSRPDLGLIASSCNNVGNLNQNPLGIFGHGSAARQFPDLIREELRTVCFIAVLIPRRTIDLVGLMDERYVGYGMDDDDACLTVRRAGLKLGIFDGCFVDHHSLTSSFRAPSPTNSSPGDFRPNMRLFIEKWGTDNWGKGRDESQFRDLFPPV